MVFIRMQRGLGASSESLGGALGAFDAIFHPGAHRAREELKQANERKIAIPSPGDRLLHENRITIRIKGPGVPPALDAVEDKPA